MNELTKIIFEKLGLEVGEEFKIVFSTGGESDNTFFIDEYLNIWIVTEKGNVKGSFIIIKDLILGKDFGIKKLSKPLLTEEEKEFLNYFKFDSLKKIRRTIILSINISPKNSISYILDLNILRLSFNGLQFDKEYSRKELGC